MSLAQWLATGGVYSVPDPGTGGGGAPAGGNTGAPSGGTTHDGTFRGADRSMGGAPAAASGAASAFRLSDDALVDLGDGKSVKYGDYKAGFVPRSDYDQLTTNYNRGRQFLVDEAAKLQQQWQTIEAQKQAASRAAQQQGRPDPMAKFRDLPVVDGATLEQAYQALSEGDIGPMRQVIAQQQQQIQKVTAQLQKLTGATGSLTEQHFSQGFRSKLDRAIDGLAIEGLDFADPILKPHRAMLADLAEDVFRAYDDNDPNYEREMPAIFKTRVNGLIKLAQDLQKARVESGKRLKRTFTRPGGSATPSGPARYTHESGDQLARRLFAATDAT